MHQYPLTQHFVFGFSCVLVFVQGEDVGTDMALRTFNHLLRYGEPVIRRTVPLAIALLCTSNPKLTVRRAVSIYHQRCARQGYSARTPLGDS